MVLLSIPQKHFILQTTTALFMHGAADSRAAAELRAPSIKGVMRFWFRALMGSLVDLQHLKNLEGEVFGDTRGGHRLIVRVTSQNYRPQEKRLLPHSERKSKVSSMAFVPGSQFEVMLASRGKVDPPLTSARLDAAAWSLWLAANLGGFGQRSRRGAGSLKLVAIEPSTQTMRPAVKLENAQAIKTYLEEGLNVSHACFQSLFRPETPPAGDVRFPKLAEGESRIAIGQLNAANEEQARAKIMKLREAVDSTHLDPAFGSAGERGRLASPLIVHLHPGAQGEFWAVATWFRHQVRTDGAKLALVEKFLECLKGNSGEEVTIPWMKTSGVKK